MVREDTLTKNLEEAESGDINDRDLVIGGGGGIFLTKLLGNQSPDTVKVYARSVELLLGLVEVTHTDLTEVTRVIFIEVDALVMLTTGVTATGRMLTVLTCESKGDA